jgi:hypothetical protein
MPRLEKQSQGRWGAQDGEEGMREIRDIHNPQTLSLYSGKYVWSMFVLTDSQLPYLLC